LTPEDLNELRQLAYRYADAVDRRDRDAFVDVFTPDGVLRVQPDDGPVESERSGADLGKVIDLIERYHRTLHHVGGEVFEPGADPDHDATGRVTCVAHHYDRTPNGPVDFVMMIVYHDRYARTEKGWRIAERRVAVGWTELHPAYPSRRPR
jgi:ketosteroid isomerase-like protein